MFNLFLTILTLKRLDMLNKSIEMIGYYVYLLSLAFSVSEVDVFETRNDETLSRLC